jgi:hypothetical protein
VANVKEEQCKDCRSFFPTGQNSYYGQKVDGLCTNNSGAKGSINGNKSPHDNISFLIQSPDDKSTFPLRNPELADKMLESGTTCFTHR